MREPTPQAAGPGFTPAGPVQQQGLRCARPRGYVQPLLHQAVTFLTCVNSVFSKFQEQDLSKIERSPRGLSACPAQLPPPSGSSSGGASFSSNPPATTSATRRDPGRQPRRAITSSGSWSSPLASIGTILSGRIVRSLAAAAWLLDATMRTAQPRNKVYPAFCRSGPFAG